MSVNSLDKDCGTSYPTLTTISTLPVSASPLGVASTHQVAIPIFEGHEIRHQMRATNEQLVEFTYSVRQQTISAAILLSDTSLYSHTSGEPS